MSQPKVQRRCCKAYLWTVVACAALSLAAATAQAAPRHSYRVAWTVYVGWMPWSYAERSGILKKWADRYGIEIKLTQVPGYVESVNRYTAGEFDACAMTNIDMLTVPAAGGVDSTAIIIGDYSNGNDGVVLKGVGRKLGDIKGQPVNLVELSVSHYLLDRGLAAAGLSEHDVRIINTSDADIVSTFAAPQSTAAVTWKPQLSQLAAQQRTSLVFDSSRVPGEILDLMVVNTRVLRRDPRLGKALAGAWYEVLALMQGDDARARAARSAMAQASGTDLKSYDSQLATTALYRTASAAAAAASADELRDRMDRVRRFSFDHGLMGGSAKSVDAIGILFPGGAVLGDPRRVRMRFEAAYMRQAAEGRL